MTHLRKRMMVSAITATLSGSQLAVAQEEPSNRLIEEVMVTAQKRAQSSQDVPISISAFSGEALDGLGITESGDLGDFIPGLEIGTSSGEGAQLIVFMRGAGLSDFNTNNAGPIGIYSDEVYISSPVLTSFQFFDTERLEILKGPQGTLYGRNTTGGAIKFITNKPTEELDLNLKASVASFGSTDIDFALSGALSESVRARAAISKSGSDGWLKNFQTGEDENGIDTTSWRTIVDIDVSDNFDLRVNLHGAKNDSEGYKLRHVGVLPPAGTDALGYRGPEDFFEGEYNRDGKAELDSFGGYVDASYDFGDFNLTSITAYDDAESSFDEETDSSPLDLIFINYGVESETFSQELRLNGSTDKSEWLVGAFYLDEEIIQDQTVDLFRELRVLTGGTSDPFGQLTGGAPVLFARSRNLQSTETAALFGQVDYQVSDAWAITIGARVTGEERIFSARGALEDEALFGDGDLELYRFDNLRLEDDAFSWRLGANYKPNATTMWYASASRGFKSGGFNGGFLSLDAAEAAIQVRPYDPEFLTAYEMGVKTSTSDGKLRFNAALFFNDFDDLQVFTLVNTSALPIQVLDNSSAGETAGFEFDLLYYPTDNLLLSVNGALMNSELKDFISNTGQNFSGNEIARTPKTSVTGLVRYDHQLGSGNGSVYGQVAAAYKSDQFFTTENVDLLSQDAYTLVSARVGFASESGKYKVSLFGTNLTDEEYLNSAVDLSDFGLVNHYQARPRMYGIEFELDF